MADRKVFNQMTDEQVVAYVHHGNADGMEYLLNKYKALVKKRVRSFYLIGGESEDLIQEGMIGLFKAVQSYDESRDSSFFAFANICVMRQLFTAVKASRRKKHGPLNSYISFYSEAGSDDEDMALVDTLKTECSPEDLLIDKESADLMAQAIMKILSPFEKQVMKLYMDGLGYTQIAERLNKDEKSIDNALQRIKGKIKTIEY